MHKKPLELVCPAGTLAALKVAVDAGADTVYLGFADETNARNFPGLNFSREALAKGIEYAHKKQCHVYLAVNTFPQASATDPWLKAIKDAEKLGVDAIILADIGLLDYCKENHPKLRKHLSVQASASNAAAINYYQKMFDVKRVVLARVLSLPQIAELNTKINVETEVFAFGGLCVMAEGRCSLSSYVTGRSPNTCGVCSPASHVHYENHEDHLVSKLDKFTINHFSEDESAGYPTLCKGRFITNEETSYLFEEPTSLNLLSKLDEIEAAGISALKIEGRQRGKAYIEKVVKEFRKAIDSQDKTQANQSTLDSISEGQQNTTGAFEEKWR